MKHVIEGRFDSAAGYRVAIVIGRFYKITKVLKFIFVKQVLQLSALTR